MEFAQAKSEEGTQVVRQVFAGKLLWLIETQAPSCGLDDPVDLIYYYGTDSIACAAEVRHWGAITGGILAGIALLVFGIWCCRK